MTGITPIDSSSATSTDYAARARAVHAQYQGDVAAVRERAARSHSHPAATKVELARARTRADGELRRLEQADDRQRVLRAAAEAPIWRSADALAGRDARDRVQRLASADSVARAVNESSRAGDDDFVREAGYLAVQRGAEDPESDWGTLAEEFLRGTGQWDSMAKAATGHGRAAQVAVERGVYHLSHYDLPELAGMAHWEVSTLAGQDPADAVARATAAQRDAWADANRRSGQRAA